MPYLEIHPDTAEKLAIVDGDWVYIETPVSPEKVKMQAKLTYGIKQDVVHAPSHWWFPEISGSEHGCFLSSINLVLSLEGPYDPVSGATNLRGVLCKVYK